MYTNDKAIMAHSRVNYIMALMVIINAIFISIS